MAVVGLPHTLQQRLQMPMNHLCRFLPPRVVVCGDALFVMSHLCRQGIGQSFESFHMSQVLL